MGLRHFGVFSNVLEVSPTPLAILGSGLAFFVSFRTNNAYARWWEGRRLWGGLVNATRMLATQVASYLPWDGERPSRTQRELVLLVSLYIQRTPMPPAYGLISHYLALSFGLVFPLALHDDLELWVVPLNMLVAGSFLFVDELGRVLEDPFTMFWNGLPLLALSRTMESNARARLGDLDAPPAEKPDENGVLM